MGEGGAGIGRVKRCYHEIYVVPSRQNVRICNKIVANV